ncbi:MAG: hypothetical protein KGL39_44260 [Patescibacteria group bacterium]|nr:hypothetical protein [Patescibacteria group bacterium]
MADYSATNCSSVITGTGGTADRVLLSGSLSGKVVQVTNIDGADVLSFRVDGTTAVAGAAECISVPALKDASAATRAVATFGSWVQVSVIAPTNTKYQVCLVPTPGMVQ